MDQKNILLSALSVGVGVGLGLASGQTVGRWTGCNSSVEGVTAQQIELEIRSLIVDGKESKVTFDEFPYYLSERTPVLLTNAAYVHLKHLNVSKHTRNLLPASRAILLSGPAELYHQMLAKALSHYFEAKLLLLDVNDLSLKIQSKYGSSKKESSFKRSISDVSLGRMSSLLGSFSNILPREDTGGRLCRQSSCFDTQKRSMEGVGPPKHRRIASVSTEIISLSGQCSSSTPGPLKRMSSWSFDEKLFLQSLYKVLVSTSETSGIILYIRDIERLLLKSPRLYKLFDIMLKKLLGSVLILGSRMLDPHEDFGEVDERLALLFPYNIEIKPPEDETHLVSWKNQLEEDMKTIQFQDNVPSPLKTRAQRQKDGIKIPPLHKQKKLSKAAKREANALARLSKPTTITQRQTPDEYQWKLLLADQKKKEEIVAAAITSLEQPLEKRDVVPITTDANERQQPWKVCVYAKKQKNKDKNADTTDATV